LRIGRVAIGSQQGPRKPRQLIGLARVWGLASSQVAYVGDFPSDMVAARDRAQQVGDIVKALEQRNRHDLL